jgi:hypothetical protein
LTFRESFAKLAHNQNVVSVLSLGKHRFFYFKGFSMKRFFLSVLFLCSLFTTSFAGQRMSRKHKVAPAKPAAFQSIQNELITCLENSDGDLTELLTRAIDSDGLDIDKFYETTFENGKLPFEMAARLLRSEAMWSMFRLSQKPKKCLSMLKNVRERLTMRKMMDSHFFIVDQMIEGLENEKKRKRARVDDGIVLPTCSECGREDVNFDELCRGEGICSFCLQKKLVERTEQRGLGDILGEVGKATFTDVHGPLDSLLKGLRERAGGRLSEVVRPGSVGEADEEEISEEEDMIVLSGDLSSDLQRAIEENNENLLNALFEECKEFDLLLGWPFKSNGQYPLELAAHRGNFDFMWTIFNGFERLIICRTMLNKVVYRLVRDGGDRCYPYQLTVLRTMLQKLREEESGKLDGKCGRCRHGEGRLIVSLGENLCDVCIAQIQRDFHLGNVSDVGTQVAPVVVDEATQAVSALKEMGMQADLKPAVATIGVQADFAEEGCSYSELRELEELEQLEEEVKEELNYKRIEEYCEAMGAGAESLSNRRLEELREERRRDVGSGDGVATVAEMAVQTDAYPLLDVINPEVGVLSVVHNDLRGAVKANDVSEVTRVLEIQKKSLSVEELVSFLMEQDEEGRTVLHNLAMLKDGSEQIAQHLLDMCPKESREKFLACETQDQKTAIQIAVDARNIPLTKAMLTVAFDCCGKSQGLLGQVRLLSLRNWVGSDRGFK